jgi:hypothetical protein
LQVLGILLLDAAAQSRLSHFRAPSPFRGSRTFSKIQFNGFEDLIPVTGWMRIRRCSEFHHGASPMSETSIKFALVVFAFLLASFVRHPGLAATQSEPSPTIGSGAIGKCFQRNDSRAEFAHPDSVCWASPNQIDDPGV